MANSSTLSPIDDLTYDVMTVLQKKAQALQAYEKYIGDARADDDGDLVELFSEMRSRDEQHVLALKEVLAHRLDEDLGYDDETDGAEEYDEGDEEEIEAVDDVDATDVSNAAPSPRRSESAQRQR